jgi:hypothetical protein
MHLVGWFIWMLKEKKKLESGPDSSVGIATDYGPDGPGIESRWRRDFPPVQTLGNWNNKRIQITKSLNMY